MLLMLARPVFLNRPDGVGLALFDRVYFKGVSIGFLVAHYTG
jgi:hypothetical protein